MKKFLLAAAAVTASFAVPAQAADLARPAPVYAPPPPVVAVFTWTGCYVGGNGWGIWSRKEFSNTNFIPGTVVPVVGRAPIVVPAIAAGADFGSHDVSGGLGGLQGGCNYQVANWVFGIQGDYDWTGADGDGNNAAGAIGFVLPGVTNHVKIRSLASVTARAGYAWGRFLGYVKGGGAWVRDEYELRSATFVGGVGAFATADETTRGGWTVGIGGEYAFLDWLTGFAEYDYYGFGTKSTNFTCTGAAVGCAVFVPTTFGIDVKQNVNVFKVGLNLKFGGGIFGGW
jgi:outer membrane immunogenic protein